MARIASYGENTGAAIGADTLRQGSPPTPTRGRITVLSRGITQELMFNPPTVSDNKAVTYGVIPLPGASHPVLQYGSGGERIINFTVYLDGDRGRYGRLGTSRGTLSVDDLIRFYQSLLYPGEFDVLDFTAVYPSLVSFTMGPLYNGIICVVKSAPVNVTFWTPKMEPVRATINLQLSEVVQRSKTANDVFPFIDLG